MKRNNIFILSSIILLFQPVSFCYALTPTIFTYDNMGNRIIEQPLTGNPTYYPNKYYETSSGVNTKYIYIGDTLIGTAITSQNNTSINYNQGDQLNSSTIVSDDQGNVIQNIDYYPYGQVRLNNQTSSFNEHKQFIGQNFDLNSGLNYLNARYYDGTRGQFISEDPMFWTLDNDALVNPQMMNSYSYAINNPIRLTDPDGRKVAEIQPYLSINSQYKYGETIASYRGIDINSRGSYGALDFKNNLQQCAALASKFAKAQFGINIAGIGNAINYGNQDIVNQLMDNNGNSGNMTVYKNGSSVIPQENDLITWKSDDQQNGHVGVVAEVLFDSYNKSGTIYTLEQNTSRNKVLFKQNFSENNNGTYTVFDRSKGSTIHVSGWTRYSGQEPISATSWQVPLSLPETKSPIRK